ncbi:unnamed protein product [Boreogadus saida]
MQYRRQKSGAIERINSDLEVRVPSGAGSDLLTYLRQQPLHLYWIMSSGTLKPNQSTVFVLCTAWSGSSVENLPPAGPRGKVPRCGPCPVGYERRKWAFVLLRVTSAMWRPDEMGASPSILPLIGP